MIILTSFLITKENKTTFLPGDINSLLNYDVHLPTNLFLDSLTPRFMWLLSSPYDVADKRDKQLQNFIRFFCNIAVPNIQTLHNFL